MIPLISGFTASALHVLSGPDHLAAVTPIAIESKNKSWSIGMAWGIGHILGVLIIGSLFMLFRELIPVEEISKYSEQIVGFVLILIGVWAIFKIYRGDHKHLNQKNPTNEHLHVHKSYKKNLLTSIVVGVIHGLAGVSHIIAIIPALALPTKFAAAMYIVGFSTGTILAMVVYSAVLGAIAQKSFIKNKIKFLRGFRLTGSIFTILVGIGWIAQNI
jgi:sulfite exporter TauE/SafE